MPNVPSTAHLLIKLRGLMQTSSLGSISAYIVPSGDAHQSEYIADCDARREFISKFTGSNGTAVITLDKAALWTDGRYYLQASKQLDSSSWTLMKDGLPDTPTQSEWLKEVLKPGSMVGVDSTLMSYDGWRKMSKELKKSNIKLVALEDNLVDIVWEDANVLVKGVDTPRPNRPCNKLIKLDLDITGKEFPEKVEQLRQELKKKNCGSIILTALDEVAWLLNLRGSDVDFNPVFFAYCVVTMSEVCLFIDKNRLTPEVEQSIRAIHGETNINTGDVSVRILPYQSIREYVINKFVPNEDNLIWISSGASQAIVDAVPKEKRYLLLNPVTKQKAIKNDVELSNMRNCHIRDAAALCEYLAWLDQMIEAYPEGHDSLWEIQGADYLENCRKQQDHFMGLSFPSISASGPNGAVIHYHPTEATRRPISKKELYLIDSGAQYLDGTTDITRTVHFGTPTDKERECFTRVLIGHIQLAKSVFPRLTKGYLLDSFARRSLWSQGLNYMHGTGHGVGMFLNVHEGPSSISPRCGDDPGIETGQILSNEPGYYEDGAFGIRIENLVVAHKVDTPNNFNNVTYLGFETISLVPIQLKMIDVKLLSDEEIEWLNDYHEKCRKVVGDFVAARGKQSVKDWIYKETEKLVR